MGTTHKGAGHHGSAAQHHERAAEHHRKASKFYLAKDFAQAAHQAEIARGHLEHALHHSREAAKYHAEHYGDEAVRYGTEHYRKASLKQA